MMFDARRRCLPLFAIWLAVTCVAVDDSAHAAESPWQAGFARVAITPEKPLWMAGYAARTKPAEGAVHDLYARAAALRDPAGATVVFVATDLVGIPAAMTERICRAVEEQFDIPRSNVMITASHTHCGPALAHRIERMPQMSAEDRENTRAYQTWLDRRMVEVIGQALEDLQPAMLAAGTGDCGFAANRRPPIGLGPYDHSVPVLRITSPAGKVRGIIYGYACHATVLSFHRWCGDYPGFASLGLEERHPGAVALFFAGCGADQNPLPRRRLELAESYGRMLTLSVDEVVSSEMRPVNGALRTAFRTIDLEFAHVPTREELDADLKSPNRYVQRHAKMLIEQLESNGEIRSSYSYPIQVWQLGDHLTWAALGGEVVVDYALRLKRELGGEGLMITAYANDVMAYIPSERVLEEGGYEGETSMIYTPLPSKWKAGLEDRIVGTVAEMRESLRRSETRNRSP